MQATATEPVEPTVTLTMSQSEAVALGILCVRLYNKWGQRGTYVIPSIRMGNESLTRETCFQIWSSLNDAGVHVPGS